MTIIAVASCRGGGETCLGPPPSFPNVDHAREVEEAMRFPAPAERTWLGLQPSAQHLHECAGCFRTLVRCFGGGCSAVKGDLVEVAARLADDHIRKIKRQERDASGRDLSDSLEHAAHDKSLFQMIKVFHLFSSAEAGTTAHAALGGAQPWAYVYTAGWRRALTEVRRSRRDRDFLSNALSLSALGGATSYGSEEEDFDPASKWDTTEQEVVDGDEAILDQEVGLLMSLAESTLELVHPKATEQVRHVAVSVWLDNRLEHPPGSAGRLSQRQLIQVLGDQHDTTASQSDLSLATAKFRQHLLPKVKQADVSDMVRLYFIRAISHG